MVRLSVNVNKVATLRNSRGGTEPSLADAVCTCLKVGAPGITVHPRQDERHITANDVREIATILAPKRPGVEYNIEGDPRPDFLELVHELKPDQVTLVPVRPGEVTSEAGWPSETALDGVVAALKADGIRVSLFVNPTEEAIRWAHATGGDRVELFTEPYADTFHSGHDAARESFERYARAATCAHALGLGINAGHDLDLDNLVLFRELPHLSEVSIGHALMSRALFFGLDRVVREYLDVLAL